MHVAREKNNGSKSPQFLSRTNFATYWSSDYIFDTLICMFNLIVTLKCIDLLRNDPANETRPLASNDTLDHVFLLFIGLNKAPSGSDRTYYYLKMCMFLF